MGNKRVRDISINIILLGVVSFLNDASSEMITPILPLFIASLGGTGIVIGLIGGIRDSISSLFKVLCGYWADKIGKRKIFVSSGYLTSAFFKLLLSFSTAWYHLLIFSGLERVGKGLRTAPRDAIIADSMSDKRGKGFGIHRSLDTAGAISGSILVFILIWFADVNFSMIIFIAAVIAFFSLVPLLFIRETKRKPQKISLKVSLKILPKTLKMFLIVAGLFSFANFSYMFFILRTQSFFTEEWLVAAPVLLYVWFNVFYAIFAIPFGTLSDKIGRRTVLMSGYLLFSVTTLGFAFVDSLVGFIVLFALYGIVYAILDGNQRALISDLSTDNLRSTAFGVYHTLIGFIALPSSLLAGYLWEINPRITFIYACITSGVSGIVFMLSKFKSSSEDSIYTT